MVALLVKFSRMKKSICHAEMPKKSLNNLPIFISLEDEQGSFA